MRQRLLLILMLLVPCGLFAQVKTAVTGNIQDVTGVAATSGYVEFRLQPPSGSLGYSVVGIGVLAPVTARCAINGSGEVVGVLGSGPCSVWGNTAIAPASSCYAVALFPNGTARGILPGQVISGTTYDLSQPTPCPNVSVITTNSTLSVPAVSGPLIPLSNKAFPLGGPTAYYSAAYVDQLFANNVNMPLASITTQAISGAAVINNRQYCQAGATADQMAINALAALGGPGTADCTNLVGPQTFASKIAVGAGQTLQLGYAPITCTVAGSECVALSSPGAKRVGPAASFISLTQSPAAYGQSVVSLTATGAMVDGVGVSGGVLSGSEGAEEVACFHIKGASYPMALSNITVQNSSCNGKVSGIWSYNGASSFHLTHVVLKSNVINTTYTGIYIGGYAQGAVVNNDVLIEDNNIQIPALSTIVPSNWYNSRPIQAIQTNNLRVIHNFTIGGFSGPETYTHVLSGPIVYETNVQFIDNVSDGHMGFTQINGGVYNGNRVDMSLRPPSWISYDDPAFVAVYGNAPGAEIATDLNISATGNSIANQFGACYDYSANYSSFTGNSGFSCSQSVNHGGSWPAYSGCLLLDYNITNSVVAGNSFDTCGTSGIVQIGGALYPAATLTNVNIHNNTITNTQQHGIHVRNIINSHISGNLVSGANLAGGAYSSIDFTDDGSDSYQINGVIVADNITNGGAYSIYQPDPDTSFSRKNFFKDNEGFNATTAPFFLYGRRRGNSEGSGVFGQTIVVGAGTAHVSVTNGEDYIALDGTGNKVVGFIDDGSIGDVITFYVSAGTVKFINAADRLDMAGAVDVTVPLRGTITFTNIQNNPTNGQAWAQIN